MVLLSHRGPVHFGAEPSGRRVGRRGGGGLAGSLSALAAGRPDVCWVCVADGDDDAAVAAEAKGAAVVDLEPEPRFRAGDGAEPGPTGIRVRYVPVEEDAHTGFYGVVANPLLWFTQHQLYGRGMEPVLADAERHAWEHGYLAVNTALAAAVVGELEALGGEGLVLLQDYHVYLVAPQVRAACPEARIAHFVHIPWPGPDGWTVLPPPLREAVLAGLLGADLVGFQTPRDVRNFLRCAEETFGLPVDPVAGTVRVESRTVLVRDYPISVDVAALERLAASPEVEARAAELRASLLGGGRRLLLRVDRTDPSKNIVRGFEAFDLLLRAHPELAGTVTFLALLQPSRQEVAEYADYLGRIGAAVAEVNARHGPVVDLRLVEDLPLAVAAYTLADVIVVNPVADGMNLVAKEAVLVNRADGALALSEAAGAYGELGRWAETLWPTDVVQQAEALWRALTVDRAERRRRLEAAAGWVREHDVHAWLAAQVRDLLAVPGPGRPAP